MIHPYDRARLVRVKDYQKIFSVSYNTAMAMRKEDILRAKGRITVSILCEFYKFTESDLVVFFGFKRL